MNTTKEEWCDIAGYEGRYQVSNQGNVRSLEYHNAKGVKRIGLLKPAVDGSGYYRCALSKNNTLTTYKIHRLVAMAFIPNPDNLPQVNHINGNKKDNRVDNLEWTDNSGNQIHAYKLGLQKKHSAHTLKVEARDIITNQVWEFPEVRIAAKYFGINRNAVTYRIKNGLFAPKRCKTIKFRYI